MTGEPTAGRPGDRTRPSTETSTAEYDAFGPWVDEIRTPEDVPALFRGRGIDPDRARIVLKIPRNIDRRDATPQMDLYDVVIMVDDRATTVLRRVDRAVTTRSIPHGSLVAVEDSVSLLDGRVVLHARDGEALRLPYNGSSRATMTRFARQLCALAAPVPGSPPRADATARSTPEAAEDHGLLSAWRSLVRQEPQVTALHAHPRTVLRPRGGAARVLHRFRPAVLTGVVAGTTASELHLLHRRDWIRRGGRPDVSEGHAVVLRHAGAVLLARPHPRYPGVRVLSLGPGEAALQLLVPDRPEVEAAIGSVLPIESVPAG